VINFFSCVNRTINFFNRTLIAVLTHILFVTFFNMFVFHLQVDLVGPLLLNAVLLLAQSIIIIIIIMTQRASTLVVHVLDTVQHSKIQTSSKSSIGKLSVVGVWQGVSGPEPLTRLTAISARPLPCGPRIVTNSTRLWSRNQPRDIRWAMR